MQADSLLSEPPGSLVSTETQKAVPWAGWAVALHILAYADEAWISPGTTRGHRNSAPSAPNLVAFPCGITRCNALCLSELGSGLFFLLLKNYSKHNWFMKYLQLLSRREKRHISIWWAVLVGNVSLAFSFHNI